jgi:uncharacterized protein (TIGR02145 family)
MKNLLSLGLIILTLFTISSCGSDNASENGKPETVRSKNKKDYKSVTINGKEWMAENLNTSVYNNGDTIPQVQDMQKWATLKTGAWCYYENNEANGKVYGKLYNAYAVTDPRGLAPKGWHVPSYDEWSSLVGKPGEMFKPMDAFINAKNWPSHKQPASDSLGFNALPAGTRNGFGGFHDITEACGFWTSSPDNDILFWDVLFYSKAYLWRGDRKLGLSVRCVKD